MFRLDDAGGEHRQEAPKVRRGGVTLEAQEKGQARRGRGGAGQLAQAANDLGLTATSSQEGRLPSDLAANELAR